MKDELIAMGRVVSRPPRPWLGLYTVEGDDGVVIDGFSPVGPARGAGLQKGDRIVGVNGVPVTAQAEFYEQLWRGRAGDVVALSIVRADAVPGHSRPLDRPSPALPHHEPASERRRASRR